ncbi:hypothetical protein OV090_39835 [Nannocystis sp. RBIL2]|uniref:hypothetical protein n=1 Tax=Nannocystis sp. RBIL2 TaxID=2996788 RepID=UPI0022703559|nr:hypothetical protein [Nannocystis sp. RBIL2]MCY1070960.1 hypothetical protein [Nannocystis sp. RBIL2]
MSLRALAGSVVSIVLMGSACGGERGQAADAVQAAAVAEAKAIAEAPVAAEAKPPTMQAGPQAQWTFTFADEPSRLKLAGDGTVLALVNHELVAVRAGAIAWKFGAELRQVLAVAGDVVVVAQGDPSMRRDRLVMLALADGHELGAAILPDDGEQDEFAEPIRAAIVEPDQDGLLVGDSVARWFRLTPGRCVKNGCLRAAGRLPEEMFDTDAELSFGPDNRRVLREGRAVRVFDGEWQTLLSVRAHDSLGGSALGPAGLALVVDDDVVLLAPEACEGPEFAPSGWPQPRRLYSRELDECPDCPGPPLGCRRWRSYQEGVHNEALVLLPDKAVVVHVDGETRAIRDGRQAWTTNTGGLGAVLQVGERVLGFSGGLEEDDPPALYALDLAGRPQWRTPLAMKGPGSFFFTDDVLLMNAGATLLTGYEANIAVFALQ